MATRLYYSSSAFADISPDLSLLWDKVNAWVGHALLTAPGADADILEWGDEIDPSSNPLPCKDGVVSFVSPSLQAQTISGTVKGQMFADQYSPGGAGFSYSLVIRVVSHDGLTERGVLLSAFPSSLTSEFSIDQNQSNGDIETQNRYFPPSVALTPVVCEQSDYLVVELGFTRFITGDSGVDAATKSAHVYTYSEGNGDLPENETTVLSFADYSPYGVAQLDPWLEFSQNLFFVSHSSVQP